jgi:hypothetical protein
MILITSLEIETFIKWESNHWVGGGAANEGDCRAATSIDIRNHKHQNLKNNSYVDTTISDALFDLPFRRNQPQNTTDDR